jgi:hypothetical protein
MDIIEDPEQKDPTCAHCGGIHARACPRVKRMVFKGDDIAEVEFWKDWPQDDILWVEDVATVVIEAEERDRKQAEKAAKRKARPNRAGVRHRAKGR